MLLTGKVGGSANALNTAIGHLGLLSQQIGGTASHDFVPFNAVENAMSQTFGGAGVTNFKDTAKKLADELESVYRNGGGTEQGVMRQLQSLNPNASLEQKQGIIRNALELLASKQAANLYQYGLAGGKPPVDLLDPAAHAVLDQFPDIRDKYFAQPDAPLGHAAAALLTQNGGTPPSAPPPAPPPTDTPPTVGGGGGTPHADYSSMIGAPGATLATGGTRNEYDPVMASTLSTFIKKGEPYETAANFAQSHGFIAPDPKAYASAVAFAKAHNGATNVQANRTVPTTLGERLAASPAAAAVAGGAAGATAGLSDVAGRSIFGPEWDANRAALAATNPTSDLIGNVAGGAGAMALGGGALASLMRAGVKEGAARNLLAFALKNPVKAAIPGDAAYGATYGASENPDDPLAGAGIGALGGAAGGLVGTGLAKGAGAALQGVTDPAVQRLRALGIPLTAGEVLGGGFKKAQDAMTSVFGPGDMVARRYNEGRLALNKAAMNQGGQVIGAPINAVGQKGIQALDAAKSAAYSSALDPVALNLDTPDFINPMKGVMEGASAIPAGDLPQGYAKTAIQRFVGNNIMPDGTMLGTDFQKAYRGLARTANAASGKVEGHDVGQALGQAKDILAGTLSDQNPGAYDAFLRANTANRNLNVLANAVNAAKNQIGDNGEPLFTPAQLGQAATANANKYSGNIAAASGNRPFNQLINDSQQVMSSKLPDSGTAKRIAALAIASGSGSGLGYEADGSTGASGLGVGLPALLTILGTRKGQQLLTSALIKRTVADQAAGRYLSQTPQVGGSILTAAGIPLLTGP
jgi:hypothetical protein